ncbi:15265_t:CDS:1, partial [Gigaspora margarita]
TFKKAFPIQTLNILATEADQKFAKNNNLEVNPKRTTYYFYSYFKAYIDTAATNDNISTLKLEEALEKTIFLSTNPHTLACIIFYYDIQNQSTKFSISQIQQDYELKHYIEAEKFIIKHYKINIPSSLDDSLFFSLNSSTSN